MEVSGVLGLSETPASPKHAGPEFQILRPEKSNLARIGSKWFRLTRYLVQTDRGLPPDLLDRAPAPKGPQNGQKSKKSPGVGGKVLQHLF